MGYGAAAAATGAGALVFAVSPTRAVCKELQEKTNYMLGDDSYVTDAAPSGILAIMLGKLSYECCLKAMAHWRQK